MSDTVTKSKHQTVRGFLKNDVYAELSQAIINKDFERACYLAVELVCTPREIRTFTSYVIKVYAQNFVSSNGWIVEFMLQTITHILDHSRGKKCLQDTAFRSQIGTLMTVLMSEKKKDLTDVCQALSACPHDSERFTVTNVGQAAVNARYAHQLSSDAMRKLGALLFHTVRADLHASLHALNVLLKATPPHHVQPARFPFVSHLTEPQRKDVIWYVWDMLLTESQRSEASNVEKYVSNALALFVVRYNKQVKMERINLLFYALFVLANRIVKNINKNTDLVKRAGRNINIIFDEVLGTQQSSSTDYLWCVTTAANHV